MSEAKRDAPSFEERRALLITSPFITTDRTPAEMTVWLNEHGVTFEIVNDMGDEAFETVCAVGWADLKFLLERLAVHLKSAPKAT